MNKINSVLLVSFFTNTFLAIIKIFIGSVGHSSAFIADGIHTFSDLATDALGVIGDKVARKRANKRHPYGYGLFEYITSLFIGLIVAAIGIALIVDSFTKEHIQPSLVVLIFSIITLIIKILLTLHVREKGREYNNVILLSGAQESAADVASSTFVLIAVILGQFTNYNPIFEYADLIATIIVGLFIIRVAINILESSVSSLLVKHDDCPILNKKIKEIIYTNYLVKDIDDLILLRFGSYYKLVLTIRMDGELDLNDVYKVTKEIEKMIKRKEKKIRYITTNVLPIK